MEKCAFKTSVLIDRSCHHLSNDASIIFLNSHVILKKQLNPTFEIAWRTFSELNLNQFNELWRSKRLSA